MKDELESLEKETCFDEQTDFTVEEIESFFRFPLTTNYSEEEPFLAKNTEGQSIFRYLGENISGSDRYKVLQIINEDINSVKLKLKNVLFSFETLDNHVRINNKKFLIVLDIHIIKGMSKKMYMDKEAVALRKGLYNLIVNRLNNSLKNKANEI